MIRPLLLALALTAPAWAAPPAGADPNSAAATWFKSLRTPLAAALPFVPPGGI